MTTLRQFLGGLICALCGWMLTACSSEEDSLQIPEGKGYVKLNLTADAGFQTKAVDESDYANLDNYTVQILKDGTLLTGMEWKYNQISNDKLIELTPGGYELKAFYGEEYNVAGTQNGLYVVGEQAFNINEEEEKDLTLTCKPVQAKVRVIFGEKMAEYFNDYSVAFKTEAYGEHGQFVWEKDMTDPVYLKVNEKGERVTAKFTLVDKKGKLADVEDRIYELSPLDYQTITINPVVESGNLGISITINTDTNDEEIDIEIPSDWI